VKRIICLTKRNIKEIIREPISLLFMIVLPLVMEVLFYYLFHSLTSQFEMRYLAPAMVGFATTFITLFLAILVSLDRETAFITRIYTTPVKPHEFIFSYLFGVIPFGIIQVILILSVGCVIDHGLLSARILLILPASLLAIIMFASLGILIGSVFNSKAVGGIASIIVTGQSVLSGMWFPLEGLSGGFLKFMKVLPFRNISLLLQNVLRNDVDMFNDIWLPAIILCAYTAVSLALSCIFFVKNSKAK